MNKHCSIDVFECEDIVFTLIHWLDCDSLYLLKHVNTCFLRTIKAHFPQTPSPLKHYCSSLNLLTWAVEEGGCPRDLYRTRCVRYGAAQGAMGVLEWARHQACPWDELTCQAAAVGGHLSVLQWLRAQNPPCP